MPPVRFATHPLDEPVRTQAQAQDVMDSLQAWQQLPWHAAPSAYRPADPRFATVPGLCNLEPTPKAWNQAIERRMVEAIGFRVWADRQQWLDFPELGLAPMIDMTGFVAEYYSNGPDEPPGMGLRFEFPESGAMEASFRGRRDMACARLRERWGKGTSPASPLHDLMRILANRSHRKWEADLSGQQALLDSLMDEAHRAAYRACVLDEDLPAPGLRPPGAGRL